MLLINFLVRVFSIIFTILFLLSGGVLTVAYKFYYGDKLETEIIIIIPKNISTSDVADLFSAAEIVNNSIVFKAFAYLHLKRSKYIQPGEYLFEEGLNLSGVFRKILKGERYVRKLTFPEGFTNYQIFKVIRDGYGLEGDIVLPIPEGSLMPDTYNYYYGETRVYIISAMTKAMNEFLNAAWERRSSDTVVKNKQEALVLASIIEKETRLSAERSIVSSVFNNRLRIGMPLQADPTVIYALKNGETDYEYKLTSEDMKFASPYNTYVTQGLPPSPICNPSRESITAALNPEKTDYLYFVADGSGGHAFSKTYDEHKRKIR